MAGMGQSYNLPSGMMEALGQYKTALKGAKAELRDLERQARKASKTGSISPEMSKDLEFARNRRNMLEDIVAQQKVIKKPGPRGGNSSEARMEGGGTSIQELLSLQGIMKLGGGIAKRFEKWGKSAARANFVGLRRELGTLQQLGVGSDVKDMIATQQAMGNFRGARQLRQMQMQKMAAERAFYRRSATIRKINYVTSGRAMKDLAATRFSIGGSSTTLGAAGVAAGVGLAAGIGVKAVMDYVAESRRAEGKSAVGTESMLLDFERSLSLGGIGDVGSQAMIKEARQAGELANRKRFQERTQPGKIFEYLFGRSSDAIAYQDKMIENSLKRQMQVNRYGENIRRLVDEDWIKKNQRTKVRDVMLKELNDANYALNYLGHWSGAIEGDKYLDFTNFFTFGFTGNDVEDAEHKALEQVKMSNIKKYHQAIKDEQKAWSDRKNTDFAIQRIDAHERQSAVTAFERDRLTRGLTW